MHIPDGFLSTPVWAALNAGTVPAVAVMARRACVHADDSRIPFLGVMGAFVFAAQMVNFPVGAGTSGHLIGGTLLACTVGPAAAGLIMTAILAIQAFLFQDGGVLALGANVMSMAVLGVLAGYLPYRIFGAGRFRKASIFAGGFLSVVVSAAAALFFLRISDVPMPPELIGVPAVLFTVNAVLEGAITAAVIHALERLHPGWIRRPEGPPSRALLVVGAAALLLACCGFLVASSAPDGLERLSENLGISSRATALIATPLADYEATFFRSEWVRRASAGALGLLAAFAASLGAARLIHRRRQVRASGGD
jgi:cobalt/nickel transport system permease protein